MKEIAIMKKINHPNVVRLYEVIDDPRSNQVYLILEYVEGGVALPESTVKCRPLETVYIYNYQYFISLFLSFSLFIFISSFLFSLFLSLSIYNIENCMELFPRYHSRSNLPPSTRHSSWRYQTLQSLSYQQWQSQNIRFRRSPTNNRRRRN